MEPPLLALSALGDREPTLHGSVLPTAPSPVPSDGVRIVGIRLQPEVARLLAEILERNGFPETAGRVVQALELQVTVEAPLTAADYEAILEALGANCPPTLSRLRRQLLENQRYVRRVTGG